MTGMTRTVSEIRWTWKQYIGSRCKLILAVLPFLLFGFIFLASHWGMPPLPSSTVSIGTGASLLHVSPDGNTLVVLSAGSPLIAYGPIQVWDSSSGQLRHTLPLDWNALVNLHFSPDGRLVAAHKRQGDLAIVSVETGTEIARLQPQTSSYHSLDFRFTPDGRFLAYEDSSPGWEERPCIRFWNVHTQKDIGKADGLFQSLKFGPNGCEFVTHILNHHYFVDRVFQWQLPETGPPVLTKTIPVSAEEIAFAPDLAMFATYQSSLGLPGKLAEMALWDTATGKRHCSFPYDEAETRAQISFEGTGRLLVARHVNGDVHLRTTVWDVASQATPKMIVSSHDLVGISGDGKWLALPHGNGAVLLDVGSVQQRELPGRSDERPCFRNASVVFSPDSRLLAVGDIRRSSQGPFPMEWLPTPLETFLHPTDGIVVRLWDTHTSAERGTILHASTAYFLPDDQRLLTEDEAGWVVSLWSLPLQRPLGRDLGLTLFLWLLITFFGWVGVVVFPRILRALPSRFHTSAVCPDGSLPVG